MTFSEVKPSVDMGYSQFLYCISQLKNNAKYSQFYLSFGKKMRVVRQIFQKVWPF